jgi:peroxiredoxin
MIVSKRVLMLGAGAIAAAALTAGALVGTAANAAVQVGKPAPDFSAVDSKGVTRSLSEFKGKTVVLEWTNDGCPYVKKHYNGQNMQTLQKEAAADGVVWLSIISSAPGKQGYADGPEADKLTKDRGAAPTAVLLDPEGVVGKLYGARTTPHMYVIADGKIAYQGAIDDKNSADVATLKGARNYVREALAAVKTGKTPAVTATAPYGCTVKYKA